MEIIFKKVKKKFDRDITVNHAKSCDITIHHACYHAKFHDNTVHRVIVTI